MHPYEVLKRPLVTEKTQWAVGFSQPQYTFEIDTRANKQQVKEAVEVAFGVTVTRVHIVNRALKRKRDPGAKGLYSARVCDEEGHCAGEGEQQHSTI